jgi:hypothetical protein
VFSALSEYRRLPGEWLVLHERNELVTSARILAANDGCAAAY